MSGLACLRQLANGQRPGGDALLGNCRFSWGGVERIGSEAILASLAAAPMGLDDGLQGVQTAQAAALVGQDGALIADLFEGRVGRLWRIGGLPNGTVAPAVDVAVDTDMSQNPHDLYFRAEDHPCLQQQAIAPLLRSADDLIEQLRVEGALRVRGFVLRAFGDADASSALIALHLVSDEAQRSASFRLAAVAVGSEVEAVQTVLDPPNQRPWTPRL